VRERKGRTSTEHSFVLDVDLPPIPQGWCETGAAGNSAPQAVGWEANKEGKLGPR